MRWRRWASRSVVCVRAVPAALLLLAATAAASGSAHAGRDRSLYVSVAGDDAADGASAASPLRTLGRALKLAGPGTTVRLLTGRYEESLRRSLRGQADRPIRIVGEGGRPVLSGGRHLRYALWLEDSDQVVIEGIELRDYTDMGLLVVGSSNVTLRRLKVHDNGFDPQIGWVEGYGLHLDDSSDLLVEHNNVFRNGPNPRPRDEVGTGINGFAMRRAVIRRNRSHDNFGGGILVEDSVDVLVKGNRIFDNDLDVSVDQWWDAGIWVDGGGDVSLVRNRLWGNLGPGIQVSDEDCQHPTGYELRNNRSNGNYFGVFVWNFGTLDFPPESILRRSGNDWTGNSRRDIWIQRWRRHCR